MAELTTQITVVRLARDRARLFAAPAAFVLLAGGAVAGGLLAGGPAGISLMGLGGVAALTAAYLAALVSSYRLLVEPGALRLRWLGGEHHYRLVRGPVTRVPVSGHDAEALHPRFGALGWAVGLAVLRGEEPIELIRLSVRQPLILIPTDRGRLAIAPAAETDLLAALTYAVRLQERLDEVASQRGMPSAAVAPVQARSEHPAPRVLTGIERTMIEQRLAAERAAALATAEAERAAAGAFLEAASSVSADVPPVAVGPNSGAVAPVARRRERAQWQRPAWLAIPGPVSVVAALPIALPLIGASIVWIAITVTGRPILPEIEGRLLLVALGLVGPMGAIGGLIARTWYPRLGSLVVVSSLAALAMLTRTILA